MSTYYLFDAHTPDPLVPSAVRIKDVVRGATSVQLHGTFPVRVPDWIQLESDPANLQELLDMKVAALQAKYSNRDNVYGRPFIEFSHMLDHTDMAPSPFGAVMSGARIGSQFQSQALTLTRNTNPTVNQPDSDNDGYAVNVGSVRVIVEAFNLDITNPRDGRASLVYSELEFGVNGSGDPDPADIEVSVDDGVGWTTANATGGLIEMPAVGPNLKLRIGGNFNTNRYGIGFWAILY